MDTAMAARQVVTYNEYQLDEEADETHHHETDGCLGADPVELYAQDQDVYQQQRSLACCQPSTVHATTGQAQCTSVFT